MESHSATHVPLGRAAGALTCFVFGLTSFFGSIFIHGPVLPIMCLWPWLYRRLAEIAAAMWQALIVVSTASLPPYHISMNFNLGGLNLDD